MAAAVVQPRHDDKSRMFKTLLRDNGPFHIKARRSVVTHKESAMLVPY